MNFRREENNLEKKTGWDNTSNSKEGKKGERRESTHVQIAQSKARTKMAEINSNAAVIVAYKMVLIV